MALDELIACFIEWFNTRVADSDVPKISKDEVYIVWFCYTLGNCKALVSTTRPDHMYYELTYSNKLNTLYVDSYKKFMHELIAYS